MGRDGVAAENIDAQTREGFMKPVVHEPLMQAISRGLLFGGGGILLLIAALLNISDSTQLLITVLIIYAAALVFVILFGNNQTPNESETANVGVLGHNLSNQVNTQDYDGSEENQLVDPLDNGFDIPLL